MNGDHQRDSNGAKRDKIMSTTKAYARQPMWTSRAYELRIAYNIFIHNKLDYNINVYEFCSEWHGT